MAVYKDTKRGTWYYTGHIKDASGNSHMYKKRGFKKKSEAQRAEQIFRLSRSESSGTMTLDDVVSIYQERIGSTGIKSTTMYGDMIYYNKHLKDTFGNKQVRSINPNTIEIWINAFREKKKPDGTLYSVSTINHAKNVLSKVMNYAKRIGQIQYNPVPSVPTIKDDKTIPKKTDAELNFWELDEYNYFMTFVNSEYWKEVFTFLFQTGVREGEMFALTWENVNLVKGTVYICQSISNKTNQDHYVVTTPKNRRSIRTIVLSDSLTDMLRECYKEQNKKDGFNQGYYVFGDIRPLSRSNLSRNLDKYIKLSGVKRITPHGFRHSHASLLINNKVDDAVIAERLGHTVSELRKTYAHIYTEKKDEMKAKLDAIF